MRRLVKDAIISNIRYSCNPKFDGNHGFEDAEFIANSSLMSQYDLFDGHEAFKDAVVGEAMLLHMCGLDYWLPRQPDVGLLDILDTVLCDKYR